MIDLELTTYFLGMEIKQSQDEVFLFVKYAKQIHKKFHIFIKSLPLEDSCNSCPLEDSRTDD